MINIHCVESGGGGEASAAQQQATRDARSGTGGHL